MLKECRISHSVIGIRSRIESGCVIQDSLLMGADYYQSNFERKGDCDRQFIPIGIGSNSEIQNAIIDKNARIGCNVKILNKDRVEEAEREARRGFTFAAELSSYLKTRPCPMEPSFSH